MDAIKNLDLRRKARQETAAHQVNVAVRGYAAADITRLTNDMKTISLSADGELRYTLRTIRARARDLAMNNDHARKYLMMVVQNVPGPKGISLQPRASDYSPSGPKLDKWANQAISESWADWGRKGSCTVCGRYSWVDVQQLVAESKACDGEIFIRMVTGFKGNRHRFALQVIEADCCDELLNRDLLENGNSIRMGVEVDPWGRPVAYWFLTKHPGDYIYGSIQKTQYQRVPAEEVLHIYNPERPGMTRGVSRFHTVMLRLHMLGKYEEAALINARAGASKMGFYSKEPSATTDLAGDEKQEDGSFIEDSEPGVWTKLPAGWRVEPYDPKYPDGEIGPFRKAMLMGIASGLNVSYCSLASDLESVNYSSIRAGELDERDAWRIEQNKQIEQLNQPVYREWLDSALLAGAITGRNGQGKLVALPWEKYEKFVVAAWHPRGWDWVDPLKDENANAAAIANGTKSRTEILAEQGKDIETTFATLAEEKKLADMLGITIEPVAASANKPEAVPAPANE